MYCIVGPGGPGQPGHPGGPPRMPGPPMMGMGGPPARPMMPSKYMTAVCLVVVGRMVVTNIVCGIKHVVF